jgi:N-methylhydantoinase A
MAHAIEETTVYRGVDPSEAILVAGGGAAGFNIVAIAQRLACSLVLIPGVAPALSAAGALLSDLLSEYAVTAPTTTMNFATEAVNDVLADLRSRCDRFALASGAKSSKIELFAEARYPDQVWELEVPLTMSHFSAQADVEQLRSDFHSTHHEVFGVSDSASPVEIVSWRARVACDLGRHQPARVANGAAPTAARHRQAFFAETGWVGTPVFDFDGLPPGAPVRGPALIESPQTTVVLYPEATAIRTRLGSLLVDPTGSEALPKETHQ